MNDDIDLTEEQMLQRLDEVRNYHGDKSLPELILRLYDQLETSVDNVISRMRRAGIIPNQGWGIEKMYCNSEVITVQVKENWHGNIDRDTFLIPVSLFAPDGDAEAKIVAWIGEKRAVKDKADADKLADQEQKKLNAELAEFNRLKAKFQESQ